MSGRVPKSRDPVPKTHRPTARGRAGLGRRRRPLDAPPYARILPTLIAPAGRRHDLLSVDRQLEGPGARDRRVQIFQTLVRRTKRTPGGPARPGRHRRPDGGPRELACQGTRAAHEIAIQSARPTGASGRGIARKLTEAARAKFKDGESESTKWLFLPARRVLKEMLRSTKNATNISDAKLHLEVNLKTSLDHTKEQALRDALAAHIGAQV